MNAIFVGEKRSGKTTLAFDYSVNQTTGGVIVTDFKKEFQGWPATVSNVAEMEKFIKDGHRVIIWRPPALEDSAVAFDELADWVIAKHALALANGWEKTGFHFTLLVDEAYNLQTHAWINQRLMKILSECRPEILNVFQTFQSIKNVNSDSRSRVSDWFLFTITLPSDLKRLDEFAMPEVVEQVAQLQEHEYVHFENEKGRQNFELVNAPDDWYRSLNFTPENEKVEKVMARREDEDDWVPLQFDTADDIWDWFAKNNRRKGGGRDSGHRERASDNEGRRERGGNRGSGGNRSSNRGGNGRYQVYKAS